MLHLLTRCADEAAALHWPDDVEDRSKMVMPGDNVEMLCDMYNPIAVENGQRFNIREGGRTVSYPAIRIQGRASGVIRENCAPASLRAQMFPRYVMLTNLR